MQARQMGEGNGVETHVIILETGDEAMECLKLYAVQHNLDSASFSAIGAFERATLAYFDWEKREYLPIPVDEQTEVAAFTGDIVIGPDGETVVHVHVVLGRRDGSALAGHLHEGFVRPTLEIVLTETPGTLGKRLDPESGLPLIRM